MVENSPMKTHDICKKSDDNIHWTVYLVFFKKNYGLTVVMVAYITISKMAGKYKYLMDHNLKLSLRKNY